jgi:hypothetical protein
MTAIAGRSPSALQLQHHLQTHNTRLSLFKACTQPPCDAIYFRCANPRSRPPAKHDHMRHVRLNLRSGQTLAASAFVTSHMMHMLCILSLQPMFSNARRRVQRARVFTNNSCMWRWLLVAQPPATALRKKPYHTRWLEQWNEVVVHSPPSVHHSKSISFQVIIPHIDIAVRYPMTSKTIIVSSIFDQEDPRAILSTSTSITHEPLHF